MKDREQIARYLKKALGDEPTDFQIETYRDAQLIYHRVCSGPVPYDATAVLLVIAELIGGDPKDRQPVRETKKATK